MLELRDIHAGYDGTEVLMGVELDVREGECVTLLGRNGMGKSTIVKSIMGIVRPTRGSIILKGKRIDGQKPFKISRAGVGLVPEGRLIAPNLTVRENLVATMRGAQGGRWSLETILTMFPNLRERQQNFGDQLSGGEQQLLAIGRALLTNPDLIVLDEATEGLAPLMRRTVWDCIRTLRSVGQSILIIDKNVDVLSRLADRHYVVEKGSVVWQGTSEEFRDNRAALDAHLGVA